MLTCKKEQIIKLKNRKIFSSANADRCILRFYKIFIIKISNLSLEAKMLKTAKKISIKIEFESSKRLIHIILIEFILC